MAMTPHSFPPHPTTSARASFVSDAIFYVRVHLRASRPGTLETKSRCSCPPECWLANHPRGTRGREFGFQMWIVSIGRGPWGWSEPEKTSSAASTGDAALYECH